VEEGFAWYWTISRRGREEGSSLRSPRTSRLRSGFVLEGGADVVVEEAGLVAAHFGLAVGWKTLDLRWATIRRRR
jgi:hypothetical protein